MRFPMVMFFIMILVVMNLLGLIADGDWLGATDQSQMSAMVGHGVAESGGIPIVTPIVNWARGFWRVVSWDFGFFSGDLQIIRWFLFVLTAGAVFALAQEFRGTITSIFGRR